jgi:hypothetical protein
MGMHGMQWESEVKSLHKVRHSIEQTDRQTDIGSSLTCLRDDPSIGFADDLAAFHISIVRAQFALGLA